MLGGSGFLCIGDVTGADFVGGFNEALEGLDAFEVVGIEGLGAFYLDEVYLDASFAETVDFVGVAVALEGEAGGLAWWSRCLCKSVMARFSNRLPRSGW